MAKARKLPSGNWRVRVYAGDGRVKSFTAPTKKEAEFFASQFQMHKKISPSNKTVEQALTSYIESRSNVLSPATVREYKREADYIVNDIGHIKVERVDLNLLQRTVNKLASQYSPHTVRNYYHLLASSIQEAGATVPRGIKLPQKEKIDIEIPTDEEVSLMIASAEDDVTRVAIMLAAYCGMRRGEICALRWQDFEGGIIFVRRDMVCDEYGEWVIKPPKTYAGNRTITTPDVLTEELNSLERVEERIIPINPDALYNRYDRLLRRAGIKHYSFHALRHYHASVMLSLNIPNGYAAERLGHSTDAMLKRVYQHIMQDKKDAFADAINQNLTQKLTR